MTEGIQFVGALNLLMLATVAAIVASLNTWMLIRYIGRERVHKKIEIIKKDPLALALYVVGTVWAVFYLYASVFTRFTI